MNVQVGDIIKLENNQFVTVSVEALGSSRKWRELRLIRAGPRSPGSYQPAYL